MRFRQPIRTMGFVVTPVRLVMGLIGLAVLFPPTLWGQVDAPKSNEDGLINPVLQPIVGDQERKTLTPQQQAQRTRAIYDATKTATTLSDFQALDKLCDDALKYELSKKNEAYVKSLKGWALNRCGEKRCELARQFRNVGSLTRYSEAMAAALDDFENAIVYAPQRHRSWNSWGIALMLDRQWSAAAEKLGQAIERKPDYTAAWFNLAEVFAKQGQHSRAIEAYQFVLRMNSDDLEAINGRGLAYLSAGKTDLALQDFETVLKRQPQSAAGLINRGDAQFASANWESALSDYQAAAELKPAGAGHQRVAWLLATCPDEQVRDGKRALKLIEANLNAGNRTALAMETLAAARACVGDFKAAEATQREAIGLAGAEQPIAEDHPSKVRLTLYESEQPFVEK